MKFQVWCPECKDFHWVEMEESQFIADVIDNHGRVLQIVCPVCKKMKAPVPEDIPF